MQLGANHKRVLILQSSDHRVDDTAKFLEDDGIAVEYCRELRQITEKAEAAGAALLSSESITADAVHTIEEFRQHEPPWSDFPILVLVGSEENRIAGYSKQLGNVTFLEPSSHRETIVSATRGALWSRTHQDDLRLLLANQERTVRELDSLADLASRLLIEERPEKLTGMIFETICRPLGLDTYVFRQYDPQTGKLDVHSFTGISPAKALDFGHFRLDKSTLRRVLVERSPCIFENVQESTDPRMALHRQLGIRAWLCHPLVSGTTLVGVLCFGTRQHSHFHHDEMAILNSVCSQLAAAIARKRAERELQHLNQDLNRRVEERTAEFRDTLVQLEAFSYSIAHDLRAPLRAIRGFAQALLEDYGQALDPVGRDFLTRIESGGARMEGLIQDLLEYSRLGRSELTFEPVDLDLLIDSVLAQFDGEEHVRRPEFIVSKPLGIVCAHSATLRQILINLISNAVKFVAPGVHPRVLVRSDSIPGKVRLWIEDNGIGIAIEHREKIFGVFERLHAPDVYPGTGIGLAIVARGIRRMGGAVGIESAEGGGSRFWLELPEPAL